MNSRNMVSRSCGCVDAEADAATMCQGNRSDRHAGKSDGSAAVDARDVRQLRGKRAVAVEPEDVAITVVIEVSTSATLHAASGVTVTPSISGRQPRESRSRS